MEKNKKNKLKPFHNLNLPKYFWTITFDLFKILLSYNFMICYQLYARYKILLQLLLYNYHKYIYKQITQSSLFLWDFYDLLFKKD